MKRIFKKKKIFGVSEKKQGVVKRDKLSKVMGRVLRQYLERLKNEGLKNRISSAINGQGIDSFILKHVRKHLSAKKTISLGKGLGLVDIQYRRGGIQMDPAGLLRLAIKRITITDTQILHAIDNIIEQIQQKYVNDPEYIIDRINSVLTLLSETGIYKPKTSEEKTIYDLVIIMILNYYNADERPEWIESAINNLKKGDFVEDWIEAILENIYTVVTNVSENLYFDFKITFDSIFVRTLFNKKTNNGQISKLLMLMGVDIKKILYDIAYDYLSPSFIKGSGELLRDIAETFMCGLGGKKFGKKKKKNSFYDNSDVSIKSVTHGISDLHQITMTFGENPGTERSFRWYYWEKLDLFLEISDDKEFVGSYKQSSDCKYVSCPRPVINLGVITSYSVKKKFMYSADIKNLRNNTEYYYRICDKSGNVLSDTFMFKIKDPDKDFEFMILADSQGMVKYDYDLFLNVFNSAIKNSNPFNFVIHMGDFVDDGNNELYWEWLLNSRLWAENTIVPLSGNHEAKSSPVASRAGVKNSIIRHFNLKNLPEQSLCSGAYYSYEYGNALFIVLNTNSMDDYNRLDKKQYNWAVNTAKSSNLKWKILLTHKSPYSNGPHHDERDVRNVGEQIIRMAYEADIDLVISGHDHVYVRTPAISFGRNMGGPNKKISFNGISYDAFSNLLGTVFVTPGTSGVKNYKIDYGTTFPSEKILDLTDPVYSKIKVTEDALFFTAYKYNNCSDKSEYLDSFAIEKTDKSYKDINNNTVVKYIDCISGRPWELNMDKINKAFRCFKMLDYSQRLAVSNYRRLTKVYSLNNKYNEIISGDIEIVKNKKEFMDALKNSSIRTIIVDCAEIKFENRFGFNSKIFIDRGVCIRGSARLLFVNFIVKDGAMLILGDSICIDNSRRIVSFYSPINAIEVKDNSSVIMLDYASIRCFGGIGFKSHGIYLSGMGSNAFLNTESENFSSGEFIYAPHCETYVFIGKGKYFSYKKVYALFSYGTVKIEGGSIRGLKLMPGSKTSMYGGEIIGGYTSNTIIPIRCMGRLRIYGGNIISLGNKSIVLSGVDGRLYISPDHKGSVRINDTDIFIGYLSLIDNNKLKAIISRKSFQENYESIGFYSLSEDDVEGSLSGLKPVKSRLKNADTIKIGLSSKKFIIIAKSHRDVLKEKISVGAGATYYNLSKIYVFNKEEIRKINYKNDKRKM